MTVLKDNEIATLGPADPAAPRPELVLPGEKPHLKHA